MYQGHLNDYSVLSPTVLNIQPSPLIFLPFQPLQRHIILSISDRIFESSGSFSEITNQTSILELVLGKESGSTAGARGVLHGVPLELLALHNGHTAHVGTTIVSEAAVKSETEAVRSLLKNDLPWKQCLEVVIIRTLFIADAVKDLANTYKFHMTDEVLAPLGDIFQSRLYDWDN